MLAAVLALALVDGAIAVTARGLTRGAIASILQPAHLLREGNALLNIGFAVAAVGGSALAGLADLGVRLAAALLVDAASFLVIAHRARADARSAAAPGRAAGDARAAPRAGSRSRAQDPRVRLLLGGQSVALILFTLIIPIEVIYAKESLDTTSAGFGILLASWGAGIVAGSVLYVAVRDSSAAGLILLSTAAIGLAYLGMAGAQSLLVACLLSVLGGTGNGIQWVSVMTALQEATPQDYQARVVGLLESALAAMPGVGLPDRRRPHGRRLASHRLRRRGRGHAAARRRGPRSPCAASGSTTQRAAAAIMRRPSRRISTARPMRARSRSRPASAERPPVGFVLLS